MKWLSQKIVDLLAGVQFSDGAPKKTMNLLILKNEPCCPFGKVTDCKSVGLNPVQFDSGKVLQNLSIIGVVVTFLSPKQKTLVRF